MRRQATASTGHGFEGGRIVPCLLLVPHPAQLRIHVATGWVGHQSAIPQTHANAVSTGWPNIILNSIQFHTFPLHLTSPCAQLRYWSMKAALGFSDGWGHRKEAQYRRSTPAQRQAHTHNNRVRCMQGMSGAGGISTKIRAVFLFSDVAEHRKNSCGHSSERIRSRGWWSVVVEGLEVHVGL